MSSGERRRSGSELQEQRLFHRYPAGLRVAFRIGGKGYRGKIVNVSAGGGYISTKARPVKGSRIQMAAQSDRSRPSVWLDLRVTWTVREPTEAHPQIGFGGYWLHASSRHGETELREFLDSVLGITRVVIRPMTPPAGGETVYVYKFPEVYEPGALDDFPWLEGGPPADAPAGDSPAPKKKKGRVPPPPPAPTSPALEPLDDIPEVEPEPVGDGVDEAPVPASLNQNTQMFFADIPELEGLDDLTSTTGSGGSNDDVSGRWDFLVKKLSGIRTRPKGDAPTPVRLDGDGVVCQYRVGRKAFDAELQRCGADWVVFKPSDKVPEVWSRIVLTMKFGEGRKAPQSEIHATVTRLKETDAGQLVHCKVNQVEERANPGAYNSFVERFNR